MVVALYFTNLGQEPSEQFVGLVDAIIFGGVPAIVPVTVCALLLRKSNRRVVTGP